jgi:hypothetical protein
LKFLPLKFDNQIVLQKTKFNTLHIFSVLALTLLMISSVFEIISLSSIIFTLIVISMIDLFHEHIFPKILVLIPLLAIFTYLTQDLVLSFTLAAAPILVGSFFYKSKVNKEYIKLYLLIASPTLSFLAFAAYKGIAGLSIFMSGDGRNHALNLRNVLQNGYVTEAQQANYPSYTYLLPGTISKSYDSSYAISSNVFALGIGYTVALLLMINLVARFSKIIGLNKNSFVFILGLCIPSSGILGFVLSNGFYTTLWGITVLTSLLIATINFGQHTILKQLAICIIFSNLLYGTWALLAPIPIIIFVLNLDFSRKWTVDRYDYGYGLVAIVYSYFSFKPAFSTERQTDILNILRTDGGISSINKSVAILLWIYLFFIVKNKDIKRYLNSLAIFTLSSFFIIGLARFQNQQSFIGYFNEKIFWISTASLLPIAVGYFLLNCMKGKIANQILAVLTALVVMGSLSSYQFDQIKGIIFEWGGPSGTVAKKVFETDSPTPKIFWYYQDPANDRLGTFWASLPGNPIADKIDFSKVAAWAYGQTGQPSDLCAILNLEPKLQIITRDVAGVKRASESCAKPLKLNIVQD